MKHATAAVLTTLLLASAPAGAELVAHYALDGSGVDSSGNDHHAIVSGATPTADRFGNPGAAYAFDGTNDYIDTGLLRQAYAEDFSVSAWFSYAGAVGDTYRPIVAGQFGPFFVGKNTGNTHIGMQNGNYVSNIATGTDAWDGSWHHIAAVFDATVTGGSLTGTVYLDGSPVGSAAFSPASQAGGKIYIGHEVIQPTLFFLGSIDDVRFYDHALSAGEVAILHSIPEPETWTMLLAGMALVGWRAATRRAPVRSGAGVGPRRFVGRSARA